MSSQNRPSDGSGARQLVPAKLIHGDYETIDCDPHVKRVFSYARPSDWIIGAGAAAMGPALFTYWDKISPTFLPRGAFKAAMRLNLAISASAGILLVHQLSWKRFVGLSENKRELDLDMEEMVGKVKRGESLYGESQLSEHLQGVAARSSRYTPLASFLIPSFNFVNHPYHGVDTSKYYVQAEKELEAERLKSQ